MFTHETKIRVRYGETDQMGFMYYGNYATYYEVGRVELLRSTGLTYKQLEMDGFLLPVSDFSVKYLLPARYDEELTVRTIVSTMPGIKINFDFEIFNELDVLINTAKVQLVFMSAETNKPCRPPKYFIDAFSPYFSK
ncbi:MAG: thioesterase family protein [Flavobacterium sp.]|nr:thioesterase family protein [Flavobacterium sp.]